MEFSFVNMNLNNQATDAIFYVHKEKIDNVIKHENILSTMENLFPRNTQGLIIINLKQFYQFPDNSIRSLIASTFIDGIRNQGYQYLIID